MRISHICSNYDSFYYSFMEYQHLLGLEPRVFYFRAKERGLPDITSTYVDVRLNYRNWQRLFFYVKETNVCNDYFSIYKKEQFDIIHAHTLFSNGYIALEAKKRWGIPYIVAVRDMDVNIFLKYRINLRRLGINILLEADKVIFLSKSYKEKVLSTYIPKNINEKISNKSVIIPNGIDDYFLNNKYDRPIINIKEISILTVGFISKRKNHITVCKAVKELNRLGIRATYTIIGKVLDQKIFREIMKFQFVRYIPFLSKEELIKEYRRSDIFVMPSITETFGLTYAEAMSQGVPVIYTKGQGFDGQFNDGIVGYSVEAKSVSEIVQRINDILNRYEEIKVNVVNEVNKFNWKLISEEYTKIYSQIVRG